MKIEQGCTISCVLYIINVRFGIFKKILNFVSSI